MQNDGNIDLSTLTLVHMKHTVGGNMFFFLLKLYKLAKDFFSSIVIFKLT